MGPDNKSGGFEYDITPEELEGVLDVHALDLMRPTKTERMCIFFPQGRIAEYSFDNKEGCVYKRIGHIKEV